MRIFRELFRNFQAFIAIYESDGVDTILAPDGREFCLWDLEYLYARLPSLLPERQHQAIELCLVQNMKETDAAVAMGVSPTNPVAMYATAGLGKIVSLIYGGRIERFRSLYEATG